MQRFYGGNPGGWLDLDPRWLDAFADEMLAIKAEEKLAAIDVAPFSSPAQTDEEVSRRKDYIANLLAQIEGRPRNAEVDEYGRQILIGYDAIKEWMNYWGKVKYLPA